jgi:hypothetical protein
MKLYELADQYRIIHDLMDSEDNEHSDVELAQQLAVIEEDLDQKAENIAKLIKSTDLDVLSIAAEVERLQRRAATLTRRRDWLKAYLKTTMEYLGILKVKGVVFTVSVKQSPLACNVLDATAIPDEWRIPVPPPEPRVDKRGIIDHYKVTGELVPGVEVKSNTYLEIR